LNPALIEKYKQVHEARRVAAGVSENPYDKYAYDPVGFCSKELGLNLWAKQAEIAEALCRFPHRVLVKSANGVGKTVLAAALSVWFYLTRQQSQVIITSPKADQIQNVTFKEVRRLWGNRPGIYPKMPKIEDRPGHLLHGFTARTEAAFQGEHEPFSFIIFEEAVGIEQQFWTAARGILAAGQESMWLVIENPLDTDSYAMEDELRGGWDVYSISAFDHPNIALELDDQLPLIPSAIRLGQLALNMDDFGDWLEDEDIIEPTDVDVLDPKLYGLTELTEKQLERIHIIFRSQFWRPGPDGDARILGRYPSQSAYSIFSDAALDHSFRSDLKPAINSPVVIGCDVARHGDDATCIHVRHDNVSIEHRTFRKQDTAATADMLKEMCRKYAALAKRLPWQVPVMIDDDGVGGGVTDQRRSPPTQEDIQQGGEAAQIGRSYNFIPVRASTLPKRLERYPNCRSELLFDLAERLQGGMISLAALPHQVQQEIRRQAIGITYKLDAAGRRVAEPKEMQKSRLGRSPDDLDAVALCYYASGSVVAEFTPVEFNTRPNLFRGEATTAQLQFAAPREMDDDYEDMRKLFGNKGSRWNFRGE
jgi:hypothetical protein